MADTEINPVANAFSLKTPKLLQGRIDNLVAKTDLMTVIVKVYATGGENAMHKHPQEDHAFIVLQGQATFHLESDDNIKICNKNDGIMLPKGTSYWFANSASENLVMLRVGAARMRPESSRTFPDGRPFSGLKKENKDLLEPIVAPGEFFSL